MEGVHVGLQLHGPPPPIDESQHCSDNEQEPLSSFEVIPLIPAVWPLPSAGHEASLCWIWAVFHSGGSPRPVGQPPRGWLTFGRPRPFSRWLFTASLMRLYAKIRRIAVPGLSMG